MASSREASAKALVFKAIELATGVVVGLAALYFEPTAPKLSITILGIAVALGFATYLEGRLTRDEIHKLEDFQREFARLASSTRPVDRELFNLAIKYFGRVIPASEITQVWRDLSWIFKDRHDATNYINPKDIYNEPWADPALAIQMAKQLDGARIRKVFIVDERSELAPVKELLDKQTRVGIAMRYFQFSKIAANTVLSDLCKRLKSPDFGIFDEKCVLVWHLDKRQMSHAELIFDKKEISKYQNLFDELFNASAPCS